MRFYFVFNLVCVLIIFQNGRPGSEVCFRFFMLLLSLDLLRVTGPHEALIVVRMKTLSWSGRNANNTNELSGQELPLLLLLRLTDKWERTQTTGFHAHKHKRHCQQSCPINAVCVWTTKRRRPGSGALDKVLALRRWPLVIEGPTITLWGVVHSPSPFSSHSLSSGVIT